MVSLILFGLIGLLLVGSIFAAMILRAEFYFERSKPFFEAYCTCVKYGWWTLVAVGALYSFSYVVAQQLPKYRVRVFVEEGVGE